MRRFVTISYLTACAAMLANIPALANAENLQSIGTVRPSAMSPNGNYVVGYTQNYLEPYYEILSHEGFVWTPAEGLKWLTEYIGTSTEESGVFLSVNDAGMRVGAIKDNAMRLPASGGGDFFAPANGTTRADGEEEGLPIFKAALWRDGKLYELDGGRADIGLYSDQTDGSYAIGVSADGSMVVGYAQTSNYPSGIMRWQYNAEADKYEYLDLKTPAGAIGCVIHSISADGNNIYGNVVMSGSNGALYYPAVWTSGSDVTMVQVPGIEKYVSDFGLCAVSADGTKMLISGNGTTSYYLALYDVPTATLEPIELPSGIFGVKGNAVTDNGDIFLTLIDSSWQEKRYYYDHTNGTFLTMLEYIMDVASNLNGAPLLATHEVLAVSGDGRKLLLCNDNGYSCSSNLLTLDNPEVLAAPAPSVVNLYHSSPLEVTCTWQGIKNIPEGLTLKGYKVQIDKQEPIFTEASATGGSFSVKASAEAGVQHYATVSTVYTKFDKELTSGPSDKATAYVSEDLTLTGYDNFDDCGIDPSGNPKYEGDDWQVVNTVENPLVVQWCLDVRDYENNNPYVNMASISDIPWACSYMSRFHDATDADDFFLSFYVQSKEANELGQDRTSDFLDVEYSLNGADWETLMSICAADAQHAMWNFYQIPLGDKLAGKVFQIRFNAHGEGKACLTWSLDCIGISDKMEGETPEGLRMTAYNGEKLSLTWKNTMKAWDATYVINSSVETDACAANEGKPVMMAVDLTPEKLGAHAGEYISAVSAFIYDNPAVTAKSSQVEAIVYADNQEVGRGTFEAPFDHIYSSTAWLVNPVLIEAGKTYRVAVNLASYDSGNTPMYYQSVPEFIPGVTDLFSEDGGKNWQSMEKAIPGSNCIWSIHANITTDPADASELQKDPEIMGYNVYRNGEKINSQVVYAPYIRFTDNAPLDKASYTVQAFYHDGRVSPLSAPFEFEASSVEGVAADRPEFSILPDRIVLGGEYDSAVLYDTTGMCVARTSGSASINTEALPAGVYMLRINVADRVYVSKLLLK